MFEHLVADHPGFYARNLVARSPKWAGLIGNSSGRAAFFDACESASVGSIYIKSAKELFKHTKDLLDIYEVIDGICQH